MKATSKNCSTYEVGIWGRFSRQGHRQINNLSLLEPVTGNFNSLLSRKISLFFLSPDGPPRRPKHSEVCSMPRGAAREQEPKTQDFPVKFPVSREMQRESGLLETASTTKLNQEFSRVSRFLALLLQPKVQPRIFLVDHRCDFNGLKELSLRRDLRRVDSVRVDLLIERQQRHPNDNLDRQELPAQGH